MIDVFNPNILINYVLLAGYQRFKRIVNDWIGIPPEFYAFVEQGHLFYSPANPVRKNSIKWFETIQNAPPENELLPTKNLLTNRIICIIGNHGPVAQLMH